MFYSLSGKIVYKDSQSIAIDCSGVSFRVTTSVNTLKQLGNVGDEALVYTYLSVREDGMELYGFADNYELEFFKMLIGVSGIGPKAAVSVLSELTPDMLSLAICGGDVKSITKAQGVGPKTAQRIILELKDKVSKLAPSEISADKLTSAGSYSSEEGNKSEAVSALLALGYTQTEASRALNSLDSSDSVENLIKSALRLLSRR